MNSEACKCSLWFLIYAYPSVAQNITFSESKTDAKIVSCIWNPCGSCISALTLFSKSLLTSYFIRWLLRMFPMKSLSDHSCSYMFVYISFGILMLISAVIRHCSAWANLTKPTIFCLSWPGQMQLSSDAC